MSAAEAAAVIVLASRGGDSGRFLAERLEARGSALALLDEESDAIGGQEDFGGVNFGAPRLFKEDAHAELDTAAANLARWEHEGIRILTVLDPAYPENLRGVHDRPPLLFVAGHLRPSDDRSIAVIGSRAASREGRAAARAIAEHMVANDYTVVSGLAAGIDTAAHEAAVTAGGRTVAVIGTGLHHAYPPQNAPLQRRIADEGAVISRFQPDQAPARWTFPQRNAVSSGLARATVIVEAGPTSGSRIQARVALAHGRPVFLREPLLSHDWARELAQRPGTHVFARPHEITDAVERLTEGALVA